MKIKMRYFMATCFFVALVLSCSDTQDRTKSESQLQDVTDIHNEFDEYLNELFVKPYNVQIQYKFVSSESPSPFPVVPVRYENAIKMTNMIHYLCIEPYRLSAPDGFLQNHFPKQFSFIGSPAFKSNGSMIGGAAESGSKIVLFNINGADKMKMEELQKFFFRTVFHEFSHVLHQKKDYTADFEQITVSSPIADSKYVGDSWGSYWVDPETGTEKNPLKSGFITEYASSNRDEDFVEMIAHYVTFSSEKWERTLKEAGTVARPLLESKIRIITDYMLSEWGINIDALRNEVQKRLEEFYSKDFTNLDIKNKELK